MLVNWHVVSVYCVIQGCDQDLAVIVDESCDATNCNLSSLCELNGKMSLHFGVVTSSLTDIGLVTVTHL